jgi:hypothetical protein
MSVGEGPDPLLDRGDRLGGGTGVDVALVTAAFPHPSDVEAEEVEAVVDVDHLGLLR